MNDRRIEERFSDCLSLITEENLRESLKLILDEYLPNYWFEVGASSTGKYHPNYAAGKGGLMRHSKAAMFIGKDIFNNPLFGDNFSTHQKNLLLMSLLIHDGLKYNFEKEEYTNFAHPVLMAKFVLDNYENWDISFEDAEYMAKAIASHMGPWNTNKYDNTVLPIPETKEEIFVHLCDYLASRKLIEIKFDDNSMIINE